RRPSCLDAAIFLGLSLLLRARHISRGLLPETSTPAWHREALRTARPASPPHRRLSAALLVQAIETPPRIRHAAATHTHPLLPSPLQNVATSAKTRRGRSMRV